MRCASARWVCVYFSGFASFELEECISTCHHLKIYYESIIWKTWFNATECWYAYILCIQCIRMCSYNFMYKYSYTKIRIPTCRTCERRRAMNLVQGKLPGCSPWQSETWQRSHVFTTMHSESPNHSDKKNTSTSSVASRSVVLHSFAFRASLVC